MRDSRHSKAAEKIGAVVPCLNEEARLPAVLVQLQSLGILTVVVDDASRDRSGDVALAHGATVVKNDETLGYSASVLRGFETLLDTDRQYLITIDGDAAHDVGDVDRFLFNPGSFDMAIGDRFQSGALRHFETKYVANLFGCRIFFRSLGRTPPLTPCDVSSGLRVFTRGFATELVKGAKRCTPFGLCYYSLKECMERNLALARFAANVAYDSRQLLHTRAGELGNFLDEMLSYTESRRFAHKLTFLHEKLSRREGFLFFIDDDLFSAGWISELGGYIFQRCSRKYMTKDDEAAAVQL